VNIAKLPQLLGKARWRQDLKSVPAGACGLLQQCRSKLLSRVVQLAGEPSDFCSLPVIW
jgi:hypothetical protein